MTERQMVTLFTRKGCHLCEKAKEILVNIHDSIDFHYEEYDIDERDEWTEKYGLMIPVIMINGKEIQYGQIDKRTIIKALSN